MEIFMKHRKTHIDRPHTFEILSKSSTKFLKINEMVMALTGCIIYPKSVKCVYQIEQLNHHGYDTQKSITSLNLVLYDAW
jgi:hypothetical protein